jgi:hypothetical protein
LLEQDFSELWNGAELRQFQLAAFRNHHEFYPCHNCLWPLTPSSFLPYLQGTVLEDPPWEASDDVLKAEDLSIDETYAEELRQQDLFNELQYFIDSGKYPGPRRR